MAGPVFAPALFFVQARLEIVKQLLALCTLAMLTAPAATAQVTDDTAVIEANGAVMTKFDFEQLLSSDRRYAGSAAVPEGRRSLAISFGKALGLEAEARRRKLDQDPNIAAKIRHATHQILAFELLARLRRDYLRDEAKLLAAYEMNKGAYEQPSVRQILVRFKGSEVAARPGTVELSIDQARAKATLLRARLVGGADFAALAQQESDDLGSRNRGGNMGFIVRGVMGAGFEAAAYSLPLNTISEVIQGEQGFHVLRVEERQPLPLSNVKAVIANELAHQEAEMLMAGYKLNDAYFAK